MTIEFMLLCVGVAGCFAIIALSLHEVRENTKFLRRLRGGK